MEQRAESVPSDKKNTVPRTRDEERKDLPSHSLGLCLLAWSLPSLTDTISDSNISPVVRVI